MEALTDHSKAELQAVWDLVLLIADLLYNETNGKFLQHGRLKGHTRDLGLFFQT